MSDGGTVAGGNAENAPRRSSPSNCSAWVNVQDMMPPNEAVTVRVRRKPDAALVGPHEWTMWACNVRMHTDEVGWWMPNTKITDAGNSASKLT